MSQSLRAVCSVACLMGLAACESDFDTHWQRSDAGMDASSLDADAPEPDGETPPYDGGGPSDASDSDIPVVALPRIDCSAVMRDAGVDRSACMFNCFAACSAWCSAADSGCGDAASWLSCARCSDGGPTL